AEAAPAIREHTPQHWRRAGGYRLERLLDPDRRNVAEVLCGSEGTFAFVTEATLGLVERPPRTALGVAHFPTRRAALEAVAPILETDPAAGERVDRCARHRARAVEEYRPKLHFVQTDPDGSLPAALLIVEYDGESEAQLAAQLEALDRTLGPGGVVTRCLVDAEIRDVWAIRKVGLGLAMSARLPVQAQAFIEDAAVPVEHLPDYITRLEGVLAEHGTEAVVYAHASAGCLHVRPFLDLKRAEDVGRMERIAQASADLVKAYGGIVSSEHGDGLARSWLAPGFYGPALYEAYRRTKAAFDPEGRFNPGRVVEAPPMTEHLRYGPRYQTVELQTVFDWSASGGFAGMAEQCNGSGVCRKRDGGTMCPSYMVTREERDATRGRANALRMALSGQLPPGALQSDQMVDVMALCVQCKACKSECPAQVDLARLKSEWLHQRWRERPVPLRTRLFAHLPRVSRRVAGRLAPLANRLNATGPARRALTRLGIAEERALPPFARHPFEGETDGSTREGERVVLYADTFCRYHEPEVARAAVR
ncbi:MAG: FAD-linked oxidase C-terminal domain-containing protein, partial [Rhodothermales bacterium]|nr:FAD-linked oxidase C-terminal domain-containing protein [Rhodothermales bacterium]